MNGRGRHWTLYLFALVLVTGCIQQLFPEIGHNLKPGVRVRFIWVVEDATDGDKSAVVPGTDERVFLESEAFLTEEHVDKVWTEAESPYPEERERADDEEDRVVVIISLTDEGYQRWREDGYRDGDRLALLVNDQIVGVWPVLGPCAAVRLYGEHVEKHGAELYQTLTGRSIK